MRLIHALISCHIRIGSLSESTSAYQIIIPCYDLKVHVFLFFFLGHIFLSFVIIVNKNFTRLTKKESLILRHSLLILLLHCLTQNLTILWVFAFCVLIQEKSTQGVTFLFVWHLHEAKFFFVLLFDHSMVE